MNNLEIIEQPVFWVGLDYFYALGIVDLQKRGGLKNLFVICLYDDPFLKEFEKQGIVVYCLEREIGEKIKDFPKNTGHLLFSPQVREFIQVQTKKVNQKLGKEWKAAIAYFKPSLKIDLLGKKMGWELVGNSSKINKYWEDKLHFYQVGKDLGLPVLKGEVVEYREDLFQGLGEKYSLPFIAQSSLGWAGKSSYLIKDQKDWESLKKKKGLAFKISPFIQGETLINNACVLGSGKVLSSPLAYQLTNLKPFTNHPLSTCGREWKEGISKEISQKAGEITRALGKAMFARGYKGFFGLDFILDKKEELFLLECNPRLTASFVFYHFLEKEAGLVSLLEHHFLAFLGKKETKAEKRNNHSFKGGEIIQRNTSNQDWKGNQSLDSGVYSFSGEYKNKEFFVKDKEEVAVFFTSPSKVVKPGNEIIRISSREDIFEEQGRVNPEILKVRNWATSKWQKKEN